MSRSSVIPILGGGLNAVTTGIVLQILGAKTQLLSQAFADKERILKNFNDPLFASLYASGSVIPHSVKASSLNRLLLDSINIYKLISLAATSGVRQQKHFELFESSILQPDYLANLDNLKLLNSEKDNILVRRKKAIKLNGWCFDCFFSEVDSYLPFLFQFYTALGGSVKKVKNFTPDNLPNAQLIVNCLGHGTRKIFEDSSELFFVRGQLLLVETKNLPISKESGSLFSYNYTPRQGYKTSKGSGDVYSYPRTNNLVLGGSRLKGILSPKGRWEGEGFLCNTRKLNGIEFPKVMFDLNREILLESTGIDIKNYPIKAVEGYRFLREDGIRVELSDLSNSRHVIHNYGHGGSGLTLSWGTSLKVAEIILNNSNFKKRLNLSYKEPFNSHQAYLARGLSHLFCKSLKLSSNKIKTSYTSPVFSSGNKKIPKVLYIACGGTISQSINSHGTSEKKSHPDFLKLFPEIKKINEIHFKSLANIDSTDATPKLWTKIAELINRKYSSYDAFIIFMGTNTMAYASSALSFALQGIGKPVVLTGAQVPLREIANDAKLNILNAAKFCALDISGVYLIFGSRVIKGIHAKKVSEYDYVSFDSFRARGEVGFFGVRADLMKDLPYRHDFPLTVRADFEKNIACVSLLPGTGLDQISNLIKSKCRGIIIRAFGSGDIPHALHQQLKLAHKVQIPIVVMTQVGTGKASMMVNEVGRKTLKYGVIPAEEMSMEAVSTKLMWLLGQCYPYEEIVRLMKTDLIGEIKDSN